MKMIKTSQKNTIKTTRLLTGILIMAFALASCLPSEKEMEDAEQAEIQRFLADNPAVVFDSKTSGLYHHEVVPGNGSFPVENDTVYITYTGKFLDGYVFDSNVGGEIFGFIMGKGQVIKGVEEGISYMKPGGRSFFIIPFNLAYGKAGSYAIPSYTTLFFDITLVGSSTD